MLIRLMAALGAALSLAAAAQAAPQSRITAVDITRAEPAGTYGGIAFRRIDGAIHGEVAAGEPVAGLRELAAGRASVPYETRFDMILPDDPTKADGVLVEAANRGMGVMLAMLSAPPAAGAGKPAMMSPTGDGFPFAQHIAVAHVQWQAGIAPGVPETAQGVGEVVVRDFGRWLGGAFPEARAGLPVFRHRILGGVSQSAWFVNSFIAEGFNADPESRRAVYQGAFTRNGNGVVLAINRFAGGRPQFAYVPPDAAPLTPAELLSRPGSDPVVVDVASLTDFYRVRASVFARAPGGPGLHRYATQAPHAPGAALPPALVFGSMKCNGGQVVPLSPVSDGLYLRPLLLGLAEAIGLATPTPHRLPPDAPFDLIPAPPGLQDFNPLGATPLWIPRTGDDGAPAGGVPMVEAKLPLGVPEPPALPPVGVASIKDTCGNFAGWKPFAADELRRRYGVRAAYLDKASRQAAALVKAGYLLAQDEPAAVGEARARLPADFQ